MRGGQGLINEAYSNKDYETIVVEVFSKNIIAISFYMKNGFIIKKRHKCSMMRIFRSGYPVVMIKSKK